MTKKTQSKLILATNSIGNDTDVPQRSIEALRNSDILIFEEDRPARRALKLAGVHREYVKLNEHSQDLALEDARAAFQKGKSVCYMYDQGCPTLADPGRQLAELAFSYNVSVEVIPGPSSVTAALSCCPFLRGPFLFHGFLPRKPAERSNQLKLFEKSQVPVVLLDAPYRLQALLEDCHKALPRHKATLSIDITGENEQHFYGGFTHLRKSTTQLPKKLNFVLIIGPLNS